jgi:hypothetical protein
MDKPLLPEVVVGDVDASQPSLQLAAEGVQRFVWQTRHGPVLIEVRDGVAYVNGDAVEPVSETLRRMTEARPDAPQHLQPGEVSHD